MMQNLSDVLEKSWKILAVDFSNDLIWSNPFLLLKLPQVKKNRIGVALPFFFWLGTIGLLIVVIENQ